MEWFIRSYELTFVCVLGDGISGVYERVSMQNACVGGR
jgi:hypothetical protein